MRIATKHISNTITLLWLLSLYSVFGQDSTAIPTTSAFVTIHVSGGLSEFTRESSTLATNRFDQAGMRAWRAGLTIGMINSRFYQMRLELGYVERGASERFAMGNSIINSDIKLNYLQATLLPLVFKFGWRKFGLFAGSGGYASYLISSSTHYTAGGKQLRLYSVTNQIPAEYDYGIAIVGGVYVKNHLLEVRLENGMVPIFPSTSENAVRNRSLNLIFHL